MANLGKIDHQQIENQKLLDSIFNQKEAVLTSLPMAEEPTMTEAEVALEDEAPKLDFSPEEISWLRQSGAEVASEDKAPKLDFSSEKNSWLKQSEAEVALEDEIPKLYFSPEEISWLKQYRRPF